MLFHRVWINSETKKEQFTYTTNKKKTPMHQENNVLTTFSPDFYSQLILMVQQRSTKDHYQIVKKKIKRMW